MPSFTLPHKDIYAREIAIKIAQYENIIFDPDTYPAPGSKSCEPSPVFNQWNSFNIGNHYFTVIISNDTNADGTHTVTYTLK